MEELLFLGFSTEVAQSVLSNANFAELRQTLKNKGAYFITNHLFSNKIYSVELCGVLICLSETL